MSWLMFFGEAATLQRPGAAVRGSDGRTVGNAYTSTAIICSLQPLSEDQWSVAELGGRQSDFVKLYTETQLYSGDPRPGATADQPDRITLDSTGQTYEVVQVNEYRRGQPLAHYRAVCRRVDEYQEGSRT